jgi:hypothetical protein
MGSLVRRQLRAVVIVLTGAALLLLLVGIAVLVSAGTPPGIVASKSGGALTPFPHEASLSRLTTAAATTAFPGDGWVQAFSDRWAPDESTDTEQYLDIAHAGSILPVQVTDDEDWPAGPPAVADYPIETIVVVWAGPSQYEDRGWNNIEYATFDVDGTLVLPVTQISDNGPSPEWDTYAGDPVPAVGPTTGNVLFAWSQYRHLGPGASYTEIYYAVRGPDGAEIRGASEIASTFQYLEEVFSPAAAAFGNGFFLVAWSRSPLMGEGEAGIYYRILDTRGGAFVGPTKLTGDLIGAVSADARATRLASGHVLLTWTGSTDQGRQVYYAVLSSAGRVVQAPSRLSDAPYGVGGSDAAGLHNGNIIVAWEEHGAQAGESQIAYAMLNSIYTTTLPVATTYLTNPLEAENDAVCVARDGDDHAVLTWRGSDGQHIYAAVVGNDGQVRTWPVILRTAHGTSLDVDATGAGCGSLPTPMLPLHYYYFPLVARNY